MLKNCQAQFMLSEYTLDFGQAPVSCLNPTEKLDLRDLKVLPLFIKRFLEFVKLRDDFQKTSYSVTLSSKMGGVRVKSHIQSCQNSDIIVREGFKKKKKQSGIFHKGGGVSTDFGSVSILFFFIFKHGLNHPEMQRNFFLPLGDPPLTNFVRRSTRKSS